MKKTLITFILVTLVIPSVVSAFPLDFLFEQNPIRALINMLVISDGTTFIDGDSPFVPGTIMTRSCTAKYYTGFGYAACMCSCRTIDGGRSSCIVGFSTAMSRQQYDALPSSWCSMSGPCECSKYIIAAP